MEARMLYTLFKLVSVIAVVSLVLSQPHGNEEPNNEKKKSETLKEDDEDVAAEKNDICRTEVCKRRATLIKEYLSNDTDPCEDFYGYVCDNWINNHTTNGSYDSFQMLEHQYLKTISEMLRSMQPVYSPQAVTDKPTVLYNSCMEFTTYDKQLKAMLEILNNSNFEEWPVTTPTTGEKAMFNNASAVLLNIGMTPLIQFYVSRKIFDQFTYGIKIFPMGINMPPKMYINHAVKSVKPHIKDTDFGNFTDGLEGLKRQWLEATRQQGTARQVRLNITPIDHPEKIFTKIPLHDLLRNEFAKAGISLEKNETVELYNLELYKTIDEFLDIADPVALYNYMGLQSVLYWLSRSPLLVEDELLKQERCARLVYSAMEEVVGHLYAQKYFTTTAKMEVEEMVRRIKDAFAVAINSTNWMDDRTKEEALKKLENMTAKIGYPKWVHNTTILEKVYEHVPPLYNNMSFFNMMYNIDENRERKRMEKLQQTYNKDMEWFYSPSLVNAFFNSMANEFVYPLGGIQPPFYDLGLPWSLNFGGAGVVIAHEITHAFARVSHFNKYSARSHLPKNEKLKEFNEAAECFLYQYGNITDKEAGISLNGTTTLDENMADNSGLQIALTAYQKMVMDDCGNATTRLDGLPGMSGMQLFFVTYAMSWCNAISQNKLRNKIATDPHSPNRHRVNIPLQNSEAFATAFNCTRQSPMLENFTRKCTLW